MIQGKRIKHIGANMYGPIEVNTAEVMELEYDSSLALCFRNLDTLRPLNVHIRGYLDDMEKYKNIDLNIPALGYGMVNFLDQRFSRMGLLQIKYNVDSEFTGSDLWDDQVGDWDSQTGAWDDIATMESTHSQSAELVPMVLSYI